MEIVADRRKLYKSTDTLSLQIRLLVGGAHLLVLNDKVPWDIHNDCKLRAWQKRPATVDELRVAVDLEIAGYGIGWQPGSLKFALFDQDIGSAKTLPPVLDVAGIPYFEVKTGRAGGRHFYVPVSSGQLRGKWRVGDAGGDIRHVSGQAKLWELSDAVVDYLLSPPPGVPADRLRDIMGVQAPSVSSGGSDNIDTIEATLRRGAWNDTVRGNPVASYHGAMAAAQDMSPAGIKAAEAKAIADAQERLCWAEAKAGEILPAYYSVKARGVLAAMLAFAGNGGLCWASNGSIGQVAGLPDLKSVRRQLALLERDGYIKRVEAEADSDVPSKRSWHGKPAVVREITKRVSHNKGS